MNFAASQTIVISIDGPSNNPNITINSACDEVANQFVRLCQELGTYFDPELRFRLAHSANEKKYHYLYRLDLLNKSYSGQSGQELVRLLARLFRVIVSNVNKNTKLKNQHLLDAHLLLLVQLRGCAFDPDDLKAIMGLAQGVERRLRRLELTTEFYISDTESYGENKAKSTKITPNSDDLFGVLSMEENNKCKEKPPEKNEDQSDKTDSTDDEKSYHYKKMSYRVRTINFIGQRPSQINIGGFPAYIILPLELREKIYDEVNNYLGDKVGVVATDRRYKGDTCYEVVIGED